MAKTLQARPTRRSSKEVLNLDRTQLLIEAARYTPKSVYKRLSEYSTAAIRALLVFYTSPARETEDAVEKGMRGLSWLAEEIRCAR
jgi:hypothetical protein